MMVRKSKSQLPPPMIRGILAANVVALRDRHYASLGTVTARNRQLAEDSGTTLSQMQRIATASVGTSIDQLETLALNLKCRPQDLLIPYYSQGADNQFNADSLASGELQRPKRSGAPRHRSSSKI
jgi:hypothetical protein